MASMEERESKRLFFAFIFFILGVALGGGLVAFCSAPAPPDSSSAMTFEQPVPQGAMASA
jgi:hypothetical protein